MKTVNMHDAKSNLSRLVEAARKGEPFVIARAGTPLVKVVPLEGEGVRRTGFLAGQSGLPEDFDRMGAAEIRAMFEG
jgi:prevent-host-death family protein